MVKDLMMETNSRQDAIDKSRFFYNEKEKSMSFDNYLENVQALLNHEASYTKGFKPSDEQYRSLISQADRTLISACPGSGKTTSMLFKVLMDNKIENMALYDQLIITYTRKAASDMKKRYEELCKRHRVYNDTEMCTIHAFANAVETLEGSLEVLKPEGNRVEIGRKKIEKDEDDSEFEDSNLDLFEDDEEEEEYEIEYVDVSEISIYASVLESLSLSRKYFTIISELPNLINTLVEGDIQTDEELSSIEEFRQYDFISLEHLRKINECAFEKRMHYGVVNFTDMLLMLYNRLKKIGNIEELKFTDYYNELYFRKIYVDEFQDISKLQWRIIMELLRINPGCKLYCVGDSDQAIFKFRGANAIFLNNFRELIKEEEGEDKTVDIISYTINRRSGSNIINFASEFIKQNSERYDKTMVPYKNRESCIELIPGASKEDRYMEFIVNELNALKEKDRDRLNETAILYREHKQSSKLARRLVRSGVPIKVGDVGLNSRETNDVIGIIDMLFNPTNPILVERYLNKVMKSINKFTASLLSKKMRLKSEPTPFSQFLQQRGTVVNDLNAMRNIYKLIRDKNISKAVRIIAEMYTAAYLKLFPARLWRLEETVEIFEEYDGLDYGELQYRINRDRSLYKDMAKSAHKVSFLTFHSSKGLEFDNVYILPISDKVTPKVSLYPAEDEFFKAYLEEERRLMFVAVTRARERVVIFFDEPNGKIGRFERELTKTFHETYNKKQDVIMPADSIETIATSEDGEEFAILYNPDGSIEFV